MEINTYLNIRRETNVKRKEAAKKTKDLVRERELEGKKGEDRNRDEGK